jgi:hypothetical protein
VRSSPRFASRSSAFITIRNSERKANNNSAQTIDANSETKHSAAKERNVRNLSSDLFRLKRNVFSVGGYSDCDVLFSVEKPSMQRGFPCSSHTCADDGGVER